MNCGSQPPYGRIDQNYSDWFSSHTPVIQFVSWSRLLSGFGSSCQLRVWRSDFDILQHLELHICRKWSVWRPQYILRYLVSSVLKSLSPSTYLFSSAFEQRVRSSSCSTRALLVAGHFLSFFSLKRSATDRTLIMALGQSLLNIGMFGKYRLTQIRKWICDSKQS